jgi:hypothetical protein
MWKSLIGLSGKMLTQESDMIFRVSGENHDTWIFHFYLDWKNRFCFNV